MYFIIDTLEHLFHASNDDNLQLLDKNPQLKYTVFFHFYIILFYTIVVDGEAYSTEATEALVAMTSGQVVQCQPAAVAENNVPYIHVLSQRDHQVGIHFSKMVGNLKSIHIFCARGL